MYSESVSSCALVEVGYLIRKSLFILSRYFVFCLFCFFQTQCFNHSPKKGGGVLAQRKALGQEFLLQLVDGWPDRSHSSPGSGPAHRHPARRARAISFCPGLRGDSRGSVPRRPGQSQPVQAAALK